jgi:hypothetical protein
MSNEVYEITKNLPIPSAFTGRRSAGLRTLELCEAGDSFVTTSEHEKSKLYSWAAKNNVKITVRTIEKGKRWRVWRLSDKV